MLVILEETTVAMAEGVNGHAAEVKSAIDYVATNDVALVEQHLVTKITNHPGMRMDGNDDTGGRFDGWAVAVFELNDCKQAISAHCITSSVDQISGEIGSRQKIYGLYTP